MHYCYCPDATKEVEFERDYKLHFELKQLPFFRQQGSKNKGNWCKGDSESDIMWRSSFKDVLMFCRTLLIERTKSAKYSIPPTTLKGYVTAPHRVRSICGRSTNHWWRSGSAVLWWRWLHTRSVTPAVSHPQCHTRSVL